MWEERCSDYIMRSKVEVTVRPHSLCGEAKPSDEVKGRGHSEPHSLCGEAKPSDDVPSSTSWFPSSS